MAVADLAIAPSDFAPPLEQEMSPPDQAMSPPDLAMQRPVRLLAPLSGATATNPRPTLRWETHDFAGPAVVDLCRDRACTALVDSAHVDPMGSRARPDHALVRGVVFWRVRSLDSQQRSATWELWIGAYNSSVDTASGVVYDANGDGFADNAIGDSAEPTVSSPHAHVYFGGSDGLRSDRMIDLPNPDKNGAFIGSAAGDLDGDGFGELAVTMTNGVAQSVRIFWGGPAGPSSDSFLDIPSGAAKNFGWRLIGAGDLNGDASPPATSTATATPTLPSGRNPADRCTPTSAARTACPLRRCSRRQRRVASSAGQWRPAISTATGAAISWSPTPGVNRGDSTAAPAASRRRPRPDPTTRDCWRWLATSTVTAWTICCLAINPDTMMRRS
jgi:hypothetical protein